MGDYTKEIQWEPTQLTTIIPGDGHKPARLAWNGAGIQDIEFARAFAEDLLRRCRDLEIENRLNEMLAIMDSAGIPKLEKHNAE